MAKSGRITAAYLDGKNSTEPEPEPHKNSKKHVFLGLTKNTEKHLPSRIQRLTSKHMFLGLTKNTEKHFYHLGVPV